MSIVENTVNRIKPTNTIYMQQISNKAKQSSINKRLSMEAISAYR